MWVVMYTVVFYGKAILSYIRSKYSKIIKTDFILKKETKNLSYICLSLESVTILDPSFFVYKMWSSFVNYKNGILHVIRAPVIRKII